MRKTKLLSLLALLLTVTQGAWGTTVYVSTYEELKAAIENVSVDSIIVTANIDVPCGTSGNAGSGSTDMTGASTAQLIINRSLTLQSQAGSKYIIKRVAANGATSSALKSMIAIRGNGKGTSGTNNLTENTIQVNFTNIIIDGGAVWGSSTVCDRRKGAANAYGNAGRSMIDVYLGGMLNLEDGVEIQNGFTTKPDNSLLNDPTCSMCFGGAVRVDYHNATGGGTVNIKAGATIHDCSARDGGYGGALGAYNYARLNLYGGTVYNCSADNGGAIACTYRGADGYLETTAGTIRMYGGTISNCCATNGGALCTHGAVKDYVLGGTITSCSATNGGAIGQDYGQTEIYTVVNTSGELTISNCTNTKETSTANTGGYNFIYLNGGSIIVSQVYQVTFRDNNRDFAVLSVPQGTSLGEAFPAAPVNASFRFVGWFNGDTQVTSTTVINSDITVTAKWDFLLGSGTLANPYQITSTDEWNFLADNVNNGNTYSGKYFQLTNDITVTTMVGVGTTDGNYKSFNGTFDGNGHTLNVAFSGSGAWTAAFGALNGATIKNLHITGSISTSDYRPASIAGFISGNSTIENCWSEVAISSSKENDLVDAGAFVACVNGNQSLTLTGCLFTGSISFTDAAGYEGGGMVGYLRPGSTTTLTNCLFAPSSVSFANTGDASAVKFYMFACPPSGAHTLTLTNCYYNGTAAGNAKITAQGKQARSISAGDGVTINGLGTATDTYDVSAITAYATGIKYNDVYFAGNGDEVSLTLSHADAAEGYTFNEYTATAGTLSGTTLTMPDADVTINATWYNEVTLTDGQGVTALDTYKGQVIWVNYTRSFTEGKTSTVCLPFAYTKKEGDGSFYAFTNIEKEGSEYVATMTEPGTTTLTANTPYLYMPIATGNVDFSGLYTIPSTLTAGSTTSNGWTFKGTYETISWTDAPTGTYGFSAQDINDIYQGEFVKVGQYVRIKPMRCYLENASFAGARGMNRAAEQLPETIKVRLVSANGEVTGIGTISTKTGEGTIDSGAWYTLDGRRIVGKPSTKGIYVNKGKKVIIK